MIRKNTEIVVDNDVSENGNVISNEATKSNLIQLDFAKSALTINPCMVNIMFSL